MEAHNLYLELLQIIGCKHIKLRGVYDMDGKALIIFIILATNRSMAVVVEQYINDT